MTAIRVTPTELREEADRVASGARQTEELLNSLLASVRELAGRWEGGGSNSFQALYDEWNRGAAMTKEGMDGIATFLRAAAQQYEDADRGVANAAGR
jgi:WXG100 family type VII secretion target